LISRKNIDFKGLSVISYLVNLFASIGQTIGGQEHGLRDKTNARSYLIDTVYFVCTSAPAQ